MFKFLSYEKEDVRRTAIDLLEMQKDQIPIELLMDLLNDESKHIRSRVLQILKSAAPEVFADVVSQAMAILQGKAKDHAFHSLSKMDLADTIRDLEISSAPLLEILTELLYWPYWQVRLKAVRALGHLRRHVPDTAIRRLLELRRDPDFRMVVVRKAADDALAEILSLETGIEDE